MRLDCAHGTDPGRVRAENEDAFVHLKHPDPDRGYLIAIADGMGGASAGEVASRIAVDTLSEAYLAGDGPLPELLSRALEQANERINQAGRAGHMMGTTCTALVMANGEAHVAHIGDSRAHRIRAGALARLTSVHSVWAERVRDGVISPAVTSGRNVLTRALGPEPEVTPDLVVGLDVEVGDRFVLCSDGLWGLVTDPEILAIVRGCSLQEACRRLVDLANERGGPDNITVLVAEVCA